MKRIIKRLAATGLLSILMATSPLMLATTLAGGTDVPIGPSASVCLAGQCFQTVTNVHIEVTSTDPTANPSLGGTLTPDCDLLNWDGSISAESGGSVHVVVELTYKDGSKKMLLNDGAIVPPGGGIITLPGTSLCVDQG